MAGFHRTKERQHAGMLHILEAIGHLLRLRMLFVRKHAQKHHAVIHTEHRRIKMQRMPVIRCIRVHTNAVEQIGRDEQQRMGP